MKQHFPFYIVCFLFFSGLPTSIIAQTYPEVLFENSVLPNNYSNSQVHYQGNSWIKNLKKSLPVSDSIYFTPNNALSLNYISAEEGYWQAEVSYSDIYLTPKNGVLIFKLYIQSHTSIDELPTIQVVHADSTNSEKIHIKDFLTNFQENMWVSVEIPLKKVEGISENSGISAIRFSQQAHDGKEHQLYLDQIEILPLKTPQNKLTGAAVIHSVVPFERHVDISWRLPLTPSIRYIKIYRSENNKDFTPLAIRPIFATKYSDIIPEVGRSYYYKIVWVDFQYRESPFSNTLESKTKILSNEELLSMVQHANIQYFIDGAEFNSGMQQLKMSGEGAIVSLKLTGLGIMALITGAEQKMFSREVLIARIQKIVDFLKDAESIHGAFPALLDGRTGKGVFAASSDHAIDLHGTSYLIQGLLVAKEYLNHENAVETGIRQQITSIWNAVEWKYFMKPGSPFLFTNWSSESEFENALPLLGRDALSTYLIALASPSHNIELESYHQALTRTYSIDTSMVQDIEDVNYVEVDSIGIPRISISKPLNQLVDTLSNASKNKVYYYGLPLTMGKPNISLNRFLAAFLVFDPRSKHDEFANYFDELQNLILIQYRKSLEENTVPASLGHSLIVDSKGWVDPSSNIASYPFHSGFALQNLISIYRNFPTLFWSEYGFRAIHLEKNKVHSNLEGMHYGIAAVMIENGRTNLIWNLFSKDQDIKQVVNALFDSEIKIE